MESPPPEEEYAFNEEDYTTLMAFVTLKGTSTNEKRNELVKGANRSKCPFLAAHFKTTSDEEIDARWQQFDNWLAGTGGFEPYAVEMERCLRIAETQKPAVQGDSKK